VRGAKLSELYKSSNLSTLLNGERAWLSVAKTIVEILEAEA
jgi:hypothetical protein